MADLDINSLGDILPGRKVSSDFVEAPDLLPDLNLGPYVDQTAFGPSGLPIEHLINIASVGLPGPLGPTLGVPLPNWVGGTPGGATHALPTFNYEIKEYNSHSVTASMKIELHNGFIKSV